MGKVAGDFKVSPLEVFSKAVPPQKCNECEDSHEWWWIAYLKQVLQAPFHTALNERIDGRIDCFQWGGGIDLEIFSYRLVSFYLFVSFTGDVTAAMKRPEPEDQLHTERQGSQKQDLSFQFNL